MQRFNFFHLLLVFATSAHSFAQQQTKTPTTSIIGRWKVTKAENSGKDYQNPVGMVLDFKERNEILAEKTNSGESLQGTYEIDHTSSPASINLDLNSGKSSRGIFEISGGNLRLCFGTPRPTEFKTDEIRSRTLFVLTRESNLAAKPTTESLKATIQKLREFYVGETLTARMKAIDQILPNINDFRVILPKHADKVNRYFQLEFQAMKFLAKEMPEKVAAESRLRQIWVNLSEIDTYDARKEDRESYGAILRMIPEDIPIFNVSVGSTEGSMGGIGEFVFIGGRWLYMPSLERVPRLLPKLDEILKDSDRRMKEFMEGVRKEAAAAK